MKKLRVIIVVLMTVLAFSVSFSCDLWAQPPTEAAAIQEFAAQYKKATSETERMQLVIGAIDNELIRHDMSIATLDALFGTNYKSKIPPKSQEGDVAGVVEFKPPEISPKYHAPVVFGGWYFAFTFDNYGNVQYYTLSNVHK